MEVLDTSSEVSTRKWAITKARLLAMAAKGVSNSRNKSLATIISVNLSKMRSQHHSMPVVTSEDLLLKTSVNLIWYLMALCATQMEILVTPNSEKE